MAMVDAPGDPMVHGTVRFEESSASLARLLADEDAGGGFVGSAAAASPPPGADEPAGADAREPSPSPVLEEAPLARWVWPYVALLLSVAAVVAVLSPHEAVGRRPGLLALLVAGVLALDIVRIDVFERINVSPASVPLLALAFIFGPVGPLVAEVVIAGVRIARRTPAVQWAFDLGALSLAGAAAAGVWLAVTPHAAAAELGTALAAGAAAYLVTSLLLPIVLWLARGERLLAAWREQLAWMWPHYLAFGALAAALVISERRIGPLAVLVLALPVLMLWVAEQQYLSRSRAGVRALRQRNGELEAANRRIRDLLERAHRSYLQAITTLAYALQSHEPDVAGRTERVSQLAVIVGTEMGMAEAELHALTIGVVVHDIGRVLLRRGESPAEVPQLSAAILDPLELPATVKAVARHHFEHYDGSGQPDGLRGAEIPLAARIVAVADALDDRTTHTSTHPAHPLRHAVAELRAEAGHRYCPDVVAALARVLDRDPTLRRYFGERDGLAQAV